MFGDIKYGKGLSAKIRNVLFTFSCRIGLFHWWNYKYHVAQDRFSRFCLKCSRIEIWEPGKGLIWAGHHHSTNYPTAFDSYTSKVDLVDDVMAAHVNDLQDAVEALQAKLGVDDSAVATSFDYFWKNASGRYRIHRHDGGSDDGAILVTESATEPASLHAGQFWVDTS